ncbi:NADPH2:quinone reductase [Sinorhizobium meliloti]|uniref:quinone oxidoreductase family protein n=1 Tax=Rhizobium meliloti TaxID=382 RepID=UPI000FD7A7A6|nr:zinc-binding alcohol dehydrogenase family protein [Sinorhizobium meliloti]RVH25872.1 zinc-binding alcohol dehydrogenase family protein [Sinorhizobium meliloti]
MKAIEFRRFGSPDVLQSVDVATPSPERGEALVRVGAVGVNYFEVLMRQDRYAVTPELPMIPGVEVAGVVVAVGEDLSQDIIGSRVAVPMFAHGRGTGGYAEYVSVDAAMLVPIPDGLSFEAAVALMVQGLTALYLVRQSSLQNKTLLISAAAGGVGSLLVQLARDGGARTIVAVASSQKKLDSARSLGAHLGINYAAPDWTATLRAALNGGGVDILYDFAGGEFTHAAIDLLAPAGELVFGALGRFALSGRQVESMFALNQSLRGFALLPLLNLAGLKADLAELFNRAQEGALTVAIDSRFSLDRAADAHRAIESRRTIGKVVLVP